MEEIIHWLKQQAVYSVENIFDRFVQDKIHEDVLGYFPGRISLKASRFELF